MSAPAPHLRESDWQAWVCNHPALGTERAGKKGDPRQFPLKLEGIPPGRELGEVLLVLPSAFPLAGAYIRIDKSCHLSVPHVGYDGEVCLSRDDEPGCGLSPIDRLDALLEEFVAAFLQPWCCGELDHAFASEPFNYWAGWCGRHLSDSDPVRRVWLLEQRTASPTEFDAVLLDQRRGILAGRDSALRQRMIHSLGKDTLLNVRTLALSLDIDLVPSTWPRTTEALRRVVAGQLPEERVERFFDAPPRCRQPRLLLLHGPRCSYGFLLHATGAAGRRKGRPWPLSRMQPLMVQRVDPAWTCGRDQHPEVAWRQTKRVLVLGAGALGSQLVDQLARAGIGVVHVIDPDRMEAPNLGRHLLGFDALGHLKAAWLASHIGTLLPSCQVEYSECCAVTWLAKHGLSDIDCVLDLTGEPEVRYQLDAARQNHPVDTLIGWMEPFVAAAHACLLPAGSLWSKSDTDPLHACQAFDWPDDVLQREPGCSSRFQSYTAAEAMHAVALIATAALDLLDGMISTPTIRSWVRGEVYIQSHASTACRRQWAELPAGLDGAQMTRSWHG